MGNITELRVNSLSAFWEDRSGQPREDDGAKLGTAALDKTKAPPMTHALRRNAVMDDIGQRGNAVLSADTSVVLQFIPSGLCHVMMLNEPVVLGRTTDVIELPIIKAQRHGVSREHCRLRREGQSLLLTDLGSTNGTMLNGERLEPFREYPLADSDEIALGTLHISIYFGARSR